MQTVVFLHLNACTENAFLLTYLCCPVTGTTNAGIPGECWRVNRHQLLLNTIVSPIPWCTRWSMMWFPSTSTIPFLSNPCNTFSTLTPLTYCISVLPIYVSNIKCVTLYFLPLPMGLFPHYPADVDSHYSCQIFALQC